MTNTAPTCAHHASAYAMFQEAFEKNIPPPEVVRSALLLGIAVGGTDMTGTAECPECKSQIQSIRSAILRAAETVRAADAKTAEAPKTPQPPRAPATAPEK